jgi:steroid Delta-isomerase
MQVTILASGILLLPQPIRRLTVPDTPVTARYFRALNERNSADFTACFTDDCEIHSPFGTPAYTGREAASAMLGSRVQLWDKLKVIPKSAYRSGNRIAVMWMAEGTNANCQQPCLFEGVSVFEVNDSGRITRLEEYWDTRAAMREVQAA